MKRFQFSLHRLLQVKQLREQLAEAQVAQARRQVELAHEQIARLQVALAEVAARLEKAVGHTLGVESWAGWFDQSNRLERALRLAEQHLAQAEQVLNQAIHTRTRISTEVETLDTLRQQHWELFRQEAQRIEQDNLDELGLRRWMQNQRKKH